MRCVIEPDGALHAAFQVLQRTGRDIQVDPVTIGGNLKFLVVPGTRRVGLEKYLGDIAVPEMVAASMGIGIGEGKELAVTAHKAQVKSSCRPQGAHRRLARWIGVAALPIGGEGGGSGRIPVRSGMLSIEPEFVVDRQNTNFVTWRRGNRLRCHRNGKGQTTNQNHYTSGCTNS